MKYLKYLDSMNFSGIFDDLIPALKILGYLFGFIVFIMMLIFTVEFSYDYKNKVTKPDGSPKVKKSSLVIMIIMDCLLFITGLLFLLFIWWIISLGEHDGEQIVLLFKYRRKQKQIL